MRYFCYIIFSIEGLKSIIWNNSLTYYSDGWKCSRNVAFIVHVISVAFHSVNRIKSGKSRDVYNTHLFLYGRTFVSSKDHPRYVIYWRFVTISVDAVCSNEQSTVYLSAYSRVVAPSLTRFYETINPDWFMDYLFKRLKASVNTCTSLCKFKEHCI